MKQNTRLEGVPRFQKYQTCPMEKAVFLHKHFQLLHFNIMLHETFKSQTSTTSLKRHKYYSVVSLLQNTI